MVKVDDEAGGLNERLTPAVLEGTIPRTNSLHGCSALFGERGGTAECRTTITEKTIASWSLGLLRAPCLWFYINLVRDAEADDSHGVTSHWLRVAQRESMFRTCFQGRVYASRP